MNSSGKSLRAPAIRLQHSASCRVGAVAYDQFGHQMAVQPKFQWSVLRGGAGGTITDSGQYTAPPAGADANDVIVVAALGVVGKAVIAVDPSSIFTADSDIGSPTPAGSASYSNGTYTIKAGGSDIYGTSDQFNFDRKTMVGDGSVVARVASLTNTNAWAKAGVMLRVDATAGSAFAAVLVSPTN